MADSPFKRWERGSWWQDIYSYHLFKSVPHSFPTSMLLPLLHQTGPWRGPQTNPFTTTWAMPIMFFKVFSLHLLRLLTKRFSPLPFLHYLHHSQNKNKPIIIIITYRDFQFLQSNSSSWNMLIWFSRIINLLFVWNQQNLIIKLLVNGVFTNSVLEDV